VESLKANAAAADLTMQQLPGTLLLSMLFSIRFILRYYAVARSARQSRDKELCGFLNWMRGTLGFMNTFTQRTEGIMALAISLKRSSGIELRSWTTMVNPGFTAPRLTRIKFYVGIAPATAPDKTMSCQR